MYCFDDPKKLFILKEVGARGFEPPTSSTPLKRATKLRYAPTYLYYTVMPSTWQIVVEEVGGSNPLAPSPYSFQR